MWVFYSTTNVLYMGTRTFLYFAIQNSLCLYEVIMQCTHSTYIQQTYEYMYVLLTVSLEFINDDSIKLVIQFIKKVTSIFSNVVALAMIKVDVLLHLIGGNKMFQYYVKHFGNNIFKSNIYRSFQAPVFFVRKWRQSARLSDESNQVLHWIQTVVCEFQMKIVLYMDS